MLLALLGIALAILTAPLSVPDGPVPMVHGRDACAGCRMHLDRPGFAAQRHDGGRVAFYDDIGCLVSALAAGGAREPVWVEVHESGELMPLSEAHLVRSESMKTPMGSGIVALRDRAAAGSLAARIRGEIVTVERLVAAAREQEERP